MARELKYSRKPHRKPATEDRRPSSDFDLTAEERATLSDPDWVTEDEADAIIGKRRERSEKPIPFEQILKRYGS